MCNMEFMEDYERRLEVFCLFFPRFLYVPNDMNVAALR